MKFFKNHQFFLLMLSVVVSFSCKNDQPNSLPPNTNSFFEIPDANFEKYLVEANIDKDGTINGKMAKADTKGVEAIDVETKNGMNIKSLVGIEYFTDLTYLNCSNNQLTSLDISENLNLWGIYCSENQLTNLDVSKNMNLGVLLCDGNQLSNLDVSKNVKLLRLSCGNNQLAKLDIIKNTQLHSLSCDQNQLTHLDLSKNMVLNSIFCSSNQLTILNISAIENLEGLYCTNNPFTTICVANVEVAKKNTHWKKDATAEYKVCN
jgi:hypothetical protein